MSAWGTRRQLSFVLVFILLIILALVIFIAVNRREPTCSDNVANQGEVDIDCGGPCTRVCPVEANEIVVLWSRVFKVKEGKYDFVAYIENPNPFGLTKLDYQVKIYDTDNIPVKDLIGQTYMNPHERALIFIPLVDLGFRVPTRAFVSFPNQPIWRRLKTDEQKPEIFIRDQQMLQTEDVYSLSAEVSNDSGFPVDDIEVYAFLYDFEGNVNHASRSFVSSLQSGQSSEIIFTWPSVVATSVKSADIVPRINRVLPNLLDEGSETVP